ncbi:hypothetical protein EV383_5967 [Pseudonocardia sediminis]|uniref:Asp23/Gls24 family envelope stress response protein n=1 Tax=Pseudonocardia sediminis TaxID=1397368 RepID=A0A4Q7V857_PSEST|nr:hypothetical protein [Pseudonocardia sediminis]RZT89013.1 hypothetical protein EV383_5967 [Pseudonocardia sediminis]
MTENVLADIAAAVLRCPSVAGLHSGDGAGIRSVVGDTIIDGVVRGPDGLLLGVTGRYPCPVTEIAAEVRAAVRGVVPDATVVVSVEDMVVE